MILLNRRFSLFFGLLALAFLLIPGVASAANRNDQIEIMTNYIYEGQTLAERPPFNGEFSICTQSSDMTGVAASENRVVCSPASGLDYWRSPDKLVWASNAILEVYLSVGGSKVSNTTWIQDIKVSPTGKNLFRNDTPTTALISDKSFRVEKDNAVCFNGCEFTVDIYLRDGILGFSQPNPTATGIVLNEDNQTVQIQSAINETTVKNSLTPPLTIQTPDATSLGSRRLFVEIPDNGRCSLSAFESLDYNLSTQGDRLGIYAYPGLPSGQTVTFDFPIPFSSEAAAVDDQPCAGTYKVVSMQDYQYWVNSSYWAPFDGMEGVTATSFTTFDVRNPILNDEEYVSLSVIYQDPEGNPILGPYNLASFGPDFSLTDPPDVAGWDENKIDKTGGLPATVGDPWVITGLFPGKYSVTFPLVSGYTNLYSVTIEEVSDVDNRSTPLEIDNLLIDENTAPVVITLCPEGSATDSCVPTTNFDELLGVNESDEGGELNTPGEGDGTFQEEGFCAEQGVDSFDLTTWGWFTRPVYTVVCNLALGTEQFMLPLLDINIPLVTSEAGETVIYLREMAGGGEVPIFGSIQTPLVVYSLWAAARDISNTFVVLALVFFGLMIIFRINSQSYAFRTLSTNLLLKVLLANLSYTVMVLLFDLFKIIAFLTRDALLSVTGEIGTGTFDGGDPFAGVQTATGIAAGGSIVTAVLALVGVPLAKAAAGIPAAFGINVIGLTSGCLLTAAGALLGAIGIAIAALLMRAIYLYISVVIAPIVFTMSVIPEFKGLFKSWWTTFIKLLAVYPLAYLVYYLLLAIGNVV